MQTSIGSPGSASVMSGSGATRWRATAFLCGLLALIAAFHAAVATWLRFSWTYDHYSHLVVIPFISAYLVYVERARIFGVIRSAPGVGLAVGLAGLILVAAAHVYRPVLNVNDFLMITTAGLVTVVIAGFIGLWGRNSARAAAFPLGFLLLSVPLPWFLLDRFIEGLRQGSAVATYALFRLIGTPVLRDGYVFALPHQTIEVARECSGIRSSMAMLVLVLLCGHLFLNSNVHRVVLVALTIPLLIVKNSVRIVVLTLLAEYVDPSFLTGKLHREGGVVFFAMAFAIIGLILRLLRRSELSSVRRSQSAAVASQHG